MLLLSDSSAVDVDRAGFGRAHPAAIERLERHTAEILDVVCRAVVVLVEDNELQDIPP